MARKALIEKSLRPPKFEVKQRNRCTSLWKATWVYAYVWLCRLCFRELALKGVLPGVKKTSW